MTTYLSKLIENRNFQQLAALKPEGICPFLNYTISPYVFTLANQGWFSWIKRTTDPTDREPPLIKKPKDKKTNRLFKNEVLVRCPNPKRNVIAGIGPWEKDQIAVRILHGSGECPFHHQSGQLIIQTIAAGQQSLDYSRLFPEVLLEAMSETSAEEAIGLFNTGRVKSISPVNIINPCRFHNHPVVYDARSLLPDDCCPHVFQQIYPHILAIMYEAAVHRRVSIQHPGDSTDLTIKLEKRLRKRPRLIKQLADGFYRLYGHFFHPLERLDYNFFLTVTDGNPGIGCSMHQGRRMTINLHSPDFLCPAGLHAVYPYLMMAAAGTQMDWGGDISENRIPCPDCAGIVYGIETT